MKRQPTFGIWFHLWKFRFFVLSLITCVLPFFLQPVYYMEPDDVLLNYIANGSYGFEGSQNLVFIRIPLGVLLKIFYKITTQVNWYAVLLVLFFVLSYAVIYDCIWACTHRYIGIFIAFLPNLTLTTCFLTFTIAGYLAVLAGGILICTTIICEKNTAFRIAGVLLLYFGYCMRDDTLIPTLFILFPLGLYALYHRYGVKELPVSVKAIWKTWRVPFLLLLILLAGTYVGDQLAYRGEGWEGYLDFTNARGDAVDYPSLVYAYHIGEFQEAGIDEVDYYMLVGWNFAERDIFTPKIMSAVGRVQAHNVSLSTRINYAKGQIDQKAILLILFPVLTFLLLVLLQKDYPKLPGLAIVSFDLLMDAVLLLWRMRFVVRAALPLALTAVIALILLGYQKPYRNQFLCMAGILLFVLLPGTFYVREFLQSVKWMRQPYGMKAHTGIRKEIQDHPENLYIIDGSILSSMYYYDHPVSKITTTDTFKNIARSGSWDTFSLRYYNQAKEYIRDPDHLLTSLLEEDHVYYVSYDASVPKMKSFLEYHTGKTLTLTSIEYDDSQFEVYQFREENEKKEERNS